MSSNQENSEHANTNCLCSIITLSLFFGLFFGLMYPEVYSSNFKLTKCNLVSTDIAYRYSCFTQCGHCQNTQSPYRCGYLLAHSQSLDPKKCLSGEGQCPVQGESCGNGYICCATLCQRCRTCSNSCNSDGKCKERVQMGNDKSLIYF